MHSTFDKSIPEAMLESRLPRGLGGRWYGLYPAVVSDIKDPNGTGRVKVTLPWSPDTGSDHYEAWARVTTFMAGNNRGAWFVPDVNDEVVLAFEAGDPRRPFVLGGVWNGVDKSPEVMDGAGQNNKKVLRSRNGVKITLDDSGGQENFIVETPAGQKITLQDGPGSVEIVDSNGNSIKLQTSGMTVTASPKLTLTATSIELSASLLTVNAPTSIFNGQVNVSAVVNTPSVVSASYTPGAGNIW